MKRVARAKKIIESAMPVDTPPAFLDNIDESAPLNDEIFDIGLFSKPEDTPEEPKLLDENKLADIRVFKQKLTAYKKSFPGKFSNLNWSVLDGNNIEEIEELYNEVMLTLNHGYQKSASMVGVAYQAAMSGLEGAAKMTSGLVLLDGLSVATAKSNEIRDDVQSLKLRLAIATLNTVVQVHLLNTQLRSNPELEERLRHPPVQNLREQYSDL